MPRPLPPLPSAEEIAAQVQAALAEDVGTGDLTAALVSAETRVTGRVVCREPAVLCGTAWFEEVFRQLDADVSVQWHAADGEPLSADQVVCALAGPARAILTGERSALNFLQTLSGTASAAALYAEAVAGTGTRVLDTRKTLPGLRRAQKYAVACGGGHNHRVGLYDAVLIKENHIAAAGSIGAALTQARQVAGDAWIEIEVESLEQLRAALASGAERILLDNFSLDQLRQAVALNAGSARLEASGGVSLEAVRVIAETGVDDISVGSITKDLKATDFSLRLDELA
jgi:nicotinate-nucleotide pyrophosphorylase (carboxylating)